MRWALKQLDDLMIEEDDTLRLQPCFSPVWDTALTLNRAGRRGRAASDAGRRAGRRTGCSTARCAGRGDWSLANPAPGAGRLVLRVPQRLLPRHRRHGDGADGAWRAAARPRSSDGDRDGGRSDRPSSAALRWLLRHAEQRRRLGGVRPRHQPRDPDQGPVRRPQRHARPELPRHHRPRAGGARPLRLPRRPSAGRAGHRVHATRRRSRDGCWFGRWGVNYIYGTWQVLQGLRSVGFDMDAPDGAPGGRLARSRCSRPAAAGARAAAATTIPRWRGQGTPTASQTAWALLGLIAAGEADSAAVRAGIEYLLRHAAGRRHLGRGASSPAPASRRCST